VLARLDDSRRLRVTDLTRTISWKDMTSQRRHRLAGLKAQNRMTGFIASSITFANALNDHKKSMKGSKVLVLGVRIRRC